MINGTGAKADQWKWLADPVSPSLGSAEEQAQALKPNLRECGCQLSITFTAWGLDPDHPGASKGQR